MAEEEEEEEEVVDAPMLDEFSSHFTVAGLTGEEEVEEGCKITEDI